MLAAAHIKLPSNQVGASRKEPHEFIRGEDVSTTCKLKENSQNKYHIYQIIYKSLILNFVEMFIRQNIYNVKPPYIIERVEECIAKI
jgi:DNA topoisomerase IA